MYPNVHSSIVYNSQDMEATSSPLTDEWIKMFIYIMKFYSVMTNEIFSFAAT